MLLRYDGLVKTLYGGEIMSANNKMELTAVIRGLQALTKSCDVVITTDSKYVLAGITEWIENSKKRNWHTASKKPVINVELWKELDGLVGGHTIELGQGT